MRHQAVMGVVAVACVAVVSAPMLGARGGVHHRGGRPAERHQYLAGVDFTADPVAFDEAAAAALSPAFADPGALILPKGPPTTPDDGVYSPFIAMNPPSLGPMRAVLKQLASLDQAQRPEPSMPDTTPLAQSRVLTPAVVEEPPERPVPPPEPPPVPPIVPDDPPPPVVVVTPVVDPPPPPPPEKPVDQPPPAPVVFVERTVEAAPPAAIPEPGTWVMLVLGFGTIGAAIRQRRPHRPAAEDCC